MDAGQTAYDQHEGMFFEVGRRSRVLLGAFLWRTERGQVRPPASSRNIPLPLLPYSPPASVSTHTRLWAACGWPST